MRTTVSIDWITCMWEGKRNSNQLQRHARELLDKPMDWFTTPTKGRFGYTEAVMADSGLIFQSGGLEVMGTGLIASGQALSEIVRESGEEMLMRILSSAKKVSRLDLAIDIHDAGRPMPQLEALVQRDEYVSFARNVQTMRSKTGITIYVGSRQSPRFLRIYDKGGESGTGLDHVRIELECKEDAANRARNAVLAYGIGTTAMSWISDFIRLDHPVWNDAMLGALDGVYEPSQRKITDTRHWLTHTIPKSIAKVMELEGTAEILTDIIDATYANIHQPLDN